jgi:hypothetical protein
MPRKETFILFLLLGAVLFGCEKTPVDAPASVPLPDPPIELPPQKPNNERSFLDQQREKVDHEAKYQPRFEIDPHWIIFSSFKSPRPDDWNWTTPKSNMRIANYTLQSDQENDAAELSIIQFEKDKGGELNKNVQRWKKHFRSDGGGPVRAHISNTKVANLPTTIVEISGEYMGMGASWHRYNYTMLIALIEFEEGNIFLKLLGPTATIHEHRNTWNSFLEQTTLISEN